MLKRTVSMTGVMVTLAASAAVANVRPETRQSGTATSLSAGWTYEQVDATNAVARDCNPHIVFTAHTGQYLSDFPASIKNARAEVLMSGETEGPLHWVKLPPGRYSITAKYGGNTQVRQVAVGTTAKGKTIMRWKVPLIDTGKE
jgi:hypothetical protein